MDTVSEKERKKYQAIWLTCAEYRDSSPADLLMPAFLQVFQTRIEPGDRLIDFGCGPAKTAPLLRQAGLSVDLVDLCDDCLDLDVFADTVGPHPTYRFWESSLWDLPLGLQKADWIVSFDVLEHLPEEKISASLEGMAIRMKKGGLVSLSLREDFHGNAVGEKLHLTVKPASWWRKEIGRFFAIEEEIVTDEECLVWSLGSLRRV